MNELWIDCGSGFIYYKTFATTIRDALEEFSNKMEHINAITDNFGWEKMELRDDKMIAFEATGRGYLPYFLKEENA